MIFGRIEVLHSKFHDPTISNLGDQSGQTNKQTNKETKRQTDIVIYIVDMSLVQRLLQHVMQYFLEYHQRCIVTIDTLYDRYYRLWEINKYLFLVLVSQKRYRADRATQYGTDVYAITAVFSNHFTTV